MKLHDWRTATAAAFATYLLLHNVVRANEETLIRAERPAHLALTLGSPAPALPGIQLGFQVAPEIQLLIGTGVFLQDDINIQPIAASARFFILQNDFTPILGAGFTYFRILGTGTFKTLDESTILGSLLIGLDWTFGEGWRTSAGVQFHYPIQLTFPFLEFGFTF